MREYDLSEKMSAQIENNFRHHPPTIEQVERYRIIRDRAREFAEVICLLTPPGREQSVAMTHLEDVVMWANAAIARGEADPNAQ